MVGYTPEELAALLNVMRAAIPVRIMLKTLANGCEKLLEAEDLSEADRKAAQKFRNLSQSTIKCINDLEKALEKNDDGI